MDALKRDEFIYDPVGTSHAFRQLEFYATVLGCNFDEQIVGAPAELIEKWRHQLWVTDGCVAELKRELGIPE
jgi:hypothetical protein